MKKGSIRIIAAFAIAGISAIANSVYAQEPYRAGTTAASFLEIGYGPQISAMGDAGVASVRDISSIYWNPAGLGHMNQNEAMVLYQPWYVGISASFVSFGYVEPEWGTFAVGLIYVSYDDEDVTTVEMQEGTGEKYNGLEMALSLSYGKRLVDWFSFGASLKYVSSRIWHESASAVAFDLGAIVNTSFLAWSGSAGDGLNIGMSISNYGTQMRYDGLDFRQTKDVSENEEGNYPHVPVHFLAESWELPLIFRIGISAYALKMENQKLTLAVDALHPNNNSESINTGGEYTITMPGYGDFSLRGGYKAMFMDESYYGLTLGFGINLHLFDNKRFRIDYSYRDLKVLSSVHSYAFAFSF